MRYDKLLQGKRALITGGAHGMGIAMAKLFARHGAAVAICGRGEGAEAEAMLKALQCECFFMQCDVSKPAELDAFCAEILHRWGYVDILVNVVGINARQKSYEITDEKYDWVQDTNLKPLVRLVRNMVPSMIARGQGGSIISISSVHGTATVPLMGSYAASKGAMQSFTTLLANELSPYGIRANVLAPGGIMTAPWLQRGKIWMEQHPGQSFLDMLNARPINPDVGDGSITDGHAEDMANAVLFLASDMSAYITGQTILADGGAAYAAHKVKHFPAPDYFAEIVREERAHMPYADELG